MKTFMKSRKWCFTVNNYDQDELLIIKMSLNDPDVIHYACFGEEEAPTTGTKHLQGFLYFKNQVMMAFVKRKLGRPDAHLEITRGSIEQNVLYCSKEGKFWEIGERPASIENLGKNGDKPDWEHIYALAESGNIEGVPPGIKIRYSRAFDWIRNRYLMTRVLDNLPVPGPGEFHNYWYWGKPGTGKSYKARTENPGAYIKMLNHWWNGYNDQEVVIIEEFSKFAIKLTEELKEWADLYPCHVESKGGSMMIRPKKIIVTSNYHPDEIWEDEQSRGPIKRRFKIVHFGNLVGLGKK